MDVGGRCVQLCGPVTGRPRADVEREFAAARDEMYRHGAAYVYSPPEMVEPTASHEDAMRDCLRTLVCFAHVLVALPGWERSEGACLEMAVARAIGVEVVELREMVG